MTVAPKEKPPSVEEVLAAKSDGVLEMIAAQCRVPLARVFDELPEGAAKRVPGSRFEELWQDLTQWGDVLFIVHTRDIVLECKGPLPPGASAQGYFNIHGDSPIGGHIKADRCAAIYFIDRLFHGRRSCSLQFINGEGEAMFKVFVPRDDKRELIAGQLGKFEELRAKMVG
ncbi:heme utilization cystosolic carrier protein HutX [Taklimakanibacter deserti]|uniref:heme utilization cystosolic carrier protein HutX n=1 Tax=Taklimakanibacter deserti TaxID=2267839 RepID=UPI000E654962